MSKSICIKGITLGMLMFIGISMSSQSHAQEYRSCLGVKGGLGLAGGFGVGVDFKVLLRDVPAIEGIVTANAHFMMLSAMYEYNKRIKVSNFFWYVGAGLDGGTYFNNFARNDRVYDKWDYNVGITAIAGIEYVFPDFPMNVCMDFKPSFRIDKYLINDKKATGWYEVYLGVRFNLARY
jgi:hypothetical protein